MDDCPGLSPPHPKHLSKKPKAETLGNIITKRLVSWGTRPGRRERKCPHPQFHLTSFLAVKFCFCAYARQLRPYITLCPYRMALHEAHFTQTDRRSIQYPLRGREAQAQQLQPQGLQRCCCDSGQRRERADRPLHNSCFCVPPA